jgi:uncharacterized membrane protein
MLKISVSYTLTLLFLLLLDAAWLGLVALPMFRGTLGQEILTFRATPGLLFYLLYAAGILVFVLPMSQAGGWPTTVAFGAFFGLVAYGTYDLTNYATLKPWTLALAATDIAWGMVLTATASTLGMLAGQALLRWLRG